MALPNAKNALCALLWPAQQCPKNAFPSAGQPCRRTLQRSNSRRMCARQDTKTRRIIPLVEGTPNARQCQARHLIMCGRLRLMDSAHLCWQSASAHSKIVWDAPASDCDAHVLRYVVNVQSAHKGVSLGPFVKVHECSDASCKINGLSPGLSHVCQVSAFTPSGFSAPSAMTVLTSNAPPTNCLRPSSGWR